MTANNSNTNIRMPQLMKPGDYPYVAFTQMRDGSWRREDSTPNNESQAFGHILGTHEEVDNSSGHKQLKVGQSFHYAGQGHTDTIDYNQHGKTGGSTVSQVSQDHHLEHGGDKWHATGGDNIHATKGLHFSHGTGGISHTSVGDKVTDHNDGNDHHNIQGDNITFVGGVKYDNVNSEFGSYVGGNHDFMVNGKIQVGTNKTYQLNVKDNFQQNVGKTTQFNAKVNTNITVPELYANLNYFNVNNMSGNATLVVGNSVTNTIINSTMIVTPAIMIGDPVEFVNTSTLQVGVLALSSNGSNGLNGQILTSNASATYWDYAHTQPAGNDQWIQINQANATGAFSTLTFDYVNNNLTVSNGIITSAVQLSRIMANGSFGNTGQLLVSGGQFGNAHWANLSTITG